MREVKLSIILLFFILVGRKVFSWEMKGRIIYKNEKQVSILEDVLLRTEEVLNNFNNKSFNNKIILKQLGDRETDASYFWMENEEGKSVLTVIFQTLPNSWNFQKNDHSKRKSLFLFRGTYSIGKNGRMFYGDLFQKQLTLKDFSRFEEATNKSGDRGTQKTLKIKKNYWKEWQGDLTFLGGFEFKDLEGIPSLEITPSPYPTPYPYPSPIPTPGIELTPTPESTPAPIFTPIYTPISTPIPNPDSTPFPESTPLPFGTPEPTFSPAESGQGIL